MKKLSSFCMQLGALLLFPMLAPSFVGAQTSTTTTTTVIPGAPVPPAQVQIETVQPAVQPTPVVVPQPGQHVVEIELAVSRGSVQAYFGRAPRGEKAEIGGLKLDIKLPSSTTVTKIVSCDDDSAGAREVTADNPWHVVVPFNGGGRFVFNIQEWDNDPVVTVALVKIDGAVVFSGHGRDDDMDNWPQKTFGPGVRKTGSREIAFVLAQE